MRPKEAGYSSASVLVVEFLGESGPSSVTTLTQEERLAEWLPLLVLDGLIFEQLIWMTEFQNAAASFHSHGRAHLPITCLTGSVLEILGVDFNGHHTV